MGGIAVRDLGTWRHLAGRFFGVLLARELDHSERLEVEELLRSEAEAAVYWAQPVADQRHGLQAARVLSRLAPGRSDLIRAALFHDAGKRHAGLGVWGRTVATLLAKLGLPTRGRFATYLNHGPLAADELGSAGVEAIVCDFARHHHATRPPSISSDDWDLLLQADHQRHA